MINISLILLFFNKIPPFHNGPNHVLISPPRGQSVTSRPSFSAAYFPVSTISYLNIIINWT